LKVSQISRRNHATAEQSDLNFFHIIGSSPTTTVVANLKCREDDEPVK
jgi:hypothetical protein